MKSENLNIQISPSIVVKRIKALSFYLDESGLPIDAIYRVDFKQRFSANVSSNMVALEIEVLYILPDKADASKERIVLDCAVQNAFEMESLSNYIVGEKNIIQLPKETIINLVSISVSHTRAVVATLSAGTLFQESLIPIVNPVEMAKSLFPELTF